MVPIKTVALYLEVPGKGESDATLASGLAPDKGFVVNVR